MSKITKPTPEAEAIVEEAVEVAPGLAVETKLLVEDNTNSDGLPEERAVAESETSLTSGLTLVSYE